MKYLKAIYRWLTWADFDRRMGATPWRKFARAFFVRWWVIFSFLLGVVGVFAGASIACSAKLDPDTPRRVGVPIFDQGIETPDLKAFATSDGGTIWIRLEAATPGGLLYVWDTITGKGGLWAFNEGLVLVKMEGSSARNWATWQASSTLVKLDRHADAKPETGILTAEYLEQQQRHIDGHRLHAQDCKLDQGGFTLSISDQTIDLPEILTAKYLDDIYHFRFDGVAADQTIDLLALKFCQDPEHNKLVDYFLMKWAESKK